MKIKITNEVVMSGGWFLPGAVIEIDDAKAAILISEGKALAHSEVLKIAVKSGAFAWIKKLVKK
ncbi:MAG TPA: hypothetical protein PKI68_01215 [Pontiellaceae bacterium]|nr:hypothetical protein [Pontiellaceae bacterium]